MGSGRDRGGLRGIHRTGLRQLPRRHGRRTNLVRREDLRPPRFLEKRLRPDECVQAEPERRAREELLPMNRSTSARRARRKALVLSAIVGASLAAMLSFGAGSAFAAYTAKVQAGTLKV